jgi:hypothetical protein
MALKDDLATAYGVHHVLAVTSADDWATKVRANAAGRGGLATDIRLLAACKEVDNMFKSRGALLFIILNGPASTATGIQKAIYINAHGTEAIAALGRNIVARTANILGSFNRVSGSFVYTAGA